MAKKIFEERANGLVEAGRGAGAQCDCKIDW